VPEVLSFEDNVATLTRLVAHFEQHVEEPMYLDREVADRIAPGTVGIRLPITRFICKVKMSQDKDAASQQSVLAQLRGNGPQLAAHAVAFDPRNDIAILRIAGLGGRALELASDPARGTGGAILGFPENGPFDVRAGRLGATRAVLTQDAYGQGPVQRSIVTLRGTVRPGNSGGPMVDARGRVVATVFAATRSGTPGGYGVPNAVVRRDLDRVGNSSVSTGPCAG